ncbi:MAG: hypothetical protein M3406_09920 [Chloroflexota bacterium]|nr:hypothetical protein [Chloroflexota bacterium]
MADTMHPEAPDDPLVTMTIEPVERPDGRYLIYYSWPPELEAPAPESMPASGDLGV